MVSRTCPPEEPKRPIIIVRPSFGPAPPRPEVDTQISSTRPNVGIKVVWPGGGAEHPVLTDSLRLPRLRSYGT